MCWILFFNKVAGLKACNFIKNGLQDRCFSVKFAKFLRNFYEFFTFLALPVLGFKGVINSIMAEVPII